MSKESTISVDQVSDAYATSKMVSRVSLGSLLGLMGQGINILRQILLVPLFLWVWGTQLYGEWLALYAVVSYISLMELGMGMYVVNRLNQCYSVKQLNDYTRILHSALLLYVSIAIMACCLIAVTVFYLPIEQWLNFKLMGHSVTSVAVVLLATQLIIAIPQGLIVSLYRTFGEFPRGAMLGNIKQVSIFGLTALILLIGGNVMHVAAIQLIPLAGVTGFVLYDLKKRHPEVLIGFEKSDLRLAITFLGPSLLFFLIQVSNGLTIQGSIMVVSAFVGSIYVAVFTVHRTLTNLIRQLVGSFNVALWPELTTLEARGEYDKLRIAHRLSVKVLFATSVFTGIWLHFAGKDIIRLWTLDKISFDQKLFDVFLLYLVVQVLWHSSGTFLSAFNRHKIPSICSALSAVLGLGLALILVRYIGMVGVVLGLLIADVVVCIWLVPLITCRVIGENIVKFWTATVLRGLPIAVVVWIATKLVYQFMNPSLLRILVMFGCVALTGISIGYLLWLNKEERRRIASLLTNLWRKVVAFLPDRIWSLNSK